MKVVETDERVPVEPMFSSRFRRRAQRRWRELERERYSPFFRWKVIQEDGRWHVVAMQNRAVKP